MVLNRCTYRLRTLLQLMRTLLSLLYDGLRFLGLCLRPSPVLAAENLFLRKQLALYQERQQSPRRATKATRLALVWLGQWCDWRQVLTVVQPKTFLHWHRQGFRLFWRWKSQAGRPRSLRTCKRSSGAWRMIIRPGARSAWRTNCCSSSVCGCRRAPCESICPALWSEVQARVCHPNAGPHLCATMRKRSWPAPSVWQSGRPCVSSLCSWSWNTPAANSSM